MQLNIRNKKGAIELSIGTIVVIVLAMSMLILGLVLVRTIFQGATYNVDQLNQNVEGEINKLFNEQGGKTYVYLPNKEAEVKQGDSFGIAIGMKNVVEGVADAGNFALSVKSSSVSTGCQLTLAQADRYINLIAGGTSFRVAPGETKYNLIKINPPSTAPLCEISYDIVYTLDGQPYADDFFIVKVVPG